MRKVLSESLLNSRPVEYIDTHDRDFRSPTSSESSGDTDKAFIEKFKALGYIDGGAAPSNQKIEMGPRRTDQKQDE